MRMSLLVRTAGAEAELAVVGRNPELEFMSQLRMFREDQQR